MIRCPRGTWPLLVALALPLVACAVIAKEHYFTPGAADTKRSYVPEETILYSNLKSDEVTVDQSGVKIVISTAASSSSSCLLFGPVLPIIPVFGLFGGGHPDGFTVWLRVDIGEHTVVFHFDEIKLVGKSSDPPRMPVKIVLDKQTAEFSTFAYHIDLVECKADSLSLPSAQYHAYEFGYVIRVQFGPPFPGEEPFQFQLGGLVVDGSNADPVSIEVVRRSGWSWQMAGP